MPRKPVLNPGDTSHSQHIGGEESDRSLVQRWIHLADDPTPGQLFTDMTINSCLRLFSLCQPLETFRWTSHSPSTSTATQGCDSGIVQDIVGTNTIDPSLSSSHDQTQQYAAADSNAPDFVPKMVLIATSLKEEETAHWVLFVVLPRQREVHAYVPLASTTDGGECTAASLGAIKALDTCRQSMDVSDIPGLAGWQTWELKKWPCPRKQDGIDCGASAVYIVAHLCVGFEPPNLVDGSLWRHVLSAIVDLHENGTTAYQSDTLSSSSLSILNGQAYSDKLDTISHKTAEVLSKPPPEPKSSTQTRDDSSIGNNNNSQDTGQQRCAVTRVKAQDYKAYTERVAEFQTQVTKALRIQRQAMDSLCKDAIQAVKSGTLAKTSLGAIALCAEDRAIKVESHRSSLDKAILERQRVLDLIEG